MNRGTPLFKPEQMAISRAKFRLWLDRHPCLGDPSRAEQMDAFMDELYRDAEDDKIAFPESFQKSLERHMRGMSQAEFWFIYDHAYRMLHLGLLSQAAREKSYCVDNEGNPIPREKFVRPRGFRG